MQLDDSHPSWQKPHGTWSHVAQPPGVGGGAGGGGVGDLVGAELLGGAGVGGAGVGGGDGAEGCIGSEVGALVGAAIGGGVGRGVGEPGRQFGGTNPRFGTAPPLQPFLSLLPFLSTSNSVVQLDDSHPSWQKPHGTWSHVAQPLGVGGGAGSGGVGDLVGVELLGGAGVGGAGVGGGDGAEGCIGSEVGVLVGAAIGGGVGEPGRQFGGTNP